MSRYHVRLLLMVFTIFFICTILSPFCSIYRKALAEEILELPDVIAVGHSVLKLKEERKVLGALGSYFHHFLHFHVFFLTF